MPTGTWQTCYKCKSDMWIPEGLNEAALRARGVIQFFCAYGHGQYYIEGETEETKLRRERDRLKQENAYLEDQRREADARATKEAKRSARIKRRAEAALCPCCNRHFSQIERHMKSKHPDVVQLHPKKSA